jgi:hypothetical protein
VGELSTRFQFIQGVNRGSDIAGEARVRYDVLLTIPDSNKLGRRRLEAHGVQERRDGAAVRVASAAVAEKGVYAHYLPARRRVGADATHASLRSNFVKRHEAAADDAVKDVLLKTNFFDFGFGI